MSKFKHILGATGVAALTAALFRMGGSDNFPKAIRRFGIPAVILLLMLFSGFGLFISLMVAGGLCGTLHLGYGEDKPYWIKFLIGLSYITPSVFLGYTHMQWITPTAFILLFRASNSEDLKEIFRWPLVEVLVGALIGLTYYLAIF